MISSNDETIEPFIKTNLPFFILPFLNLDSSLKENEHLKLSTLGVLGVLVKSHNPEVINFFSNLEVISSIIKIIENGSEISKLVTICILQRILSEDKPLDSLCEYPENLKKVGF